MLIEMGIDFNKILKKGVNSVVQFVIEVFDVIVTDLGNVFDSTREDLHNIFQLLPVFEVRFDLIFPMIGNGLEIPALDNG